MTQFMKLPPVKKVTSPVKKFLGLSLSMQILFGLIGGICVGLFFGERCGIMSIPATIFISFLQVAVIPYVLFSLIHGIGSLDRKSALKLAGAGGTILLAFWILALFYVAISQLAFPDWQSSRFFSETQVNTANAVDYYQLYIPSNPFYSLSNEMVPAIVVFSLLVGGCLIGVDYQRKKNLLNVLELIVELLSKLTHFIVRFTPLGVFAMAANAAGTMTAMDLGRVQVYLAAFILTSLLLAFLALPLLVSIFTPFRYRDFLRVSRDAMMTAFTTANLLVILPLVASGLKELMSSYDCHDDESEQLQQAILPVYFNFPDSGKMLSLIFILFAGWFTGHPLTASDYPLFMPTGLFGMFASANITIPFLLNLFSIPPDTFQIYLMAGIFNGNFGTLTAAVDIFAFTTLTICAMRGLLCFNWKYAVLAVAIIVGVSLPACKGIGLLLQNLLKPKDYVAEKLISMKISEPVETVIRDKPPGNFMNFNWLNVKLLKRITENGVLKIGYLENSMPFVYQNLYLPGKERNIPQGFESDMMNKLARDLECRLEYYPLKPDEIVRALNNNLVDIAIGGIGITLDTIEQYGLTDPVLTLHPAVIARFDKIKKFHNWNEVTKQKMKLAYSPRVIPLRTLKQVFPNATFVELKRITDFYQKKIEADACIISAEQGAAFDIMYPEYSYIVAHQINYTMLTAFAVNKTQTELIRFLNNWLRTQVSSGAMKKYYDYWILGKSGAPTAKRWCILDNIINPNL